jgi:hypothetical protein
MSSVENLTERPEDTVRRFARRLLRIDVMHAVRERTIEAYNDAGYPQAVTLRTCRECGHNWPCPTLLTANDEDEA